jgi:hypothetical protein
MSAYTRYGAGLKRLGHTQRAVVYALEAGPLSVFALRLAIDQSRQSVERAARALTVHGFATVGDMVALTPTARDWLALAPAEYRPKPPGRFRAWFPVFGLRQRQFMRLAAREGRPIPPAEVAQRLGIEHPRRVFRSLIRRGVLEHTARGFEITPIGLEWATIDRAARGLA